MTAITYTPKGEGIFTTEELDRNFASIANYTVLAEREFANVYGLIGDLSQQVNTLAQQVKPRNDALLVFAVATVGIYAGIRIGRSLMRFEIKQPKTDEQEPPIKTTSERV